MNLAGDMTQELVFERTIVAMDLGRSAVKVYSLCCGVRTKLVFPSIVVAAKTLADEDAQKSIEHETVTYGQNAYFTGEAARLHGGAESTAGLRSDWVDSKEYACLVLSAIKRLSYEGVKGLDKAYVIVGTPADLYSLEKKSLERVTSSILNGTDVKALSQPLGVYFSYVLNPNGNVIPDRRVDASGVKKSWAVIEIGEFDTGFMLMKEGVHQQDYDDTSGGISVATRALQKILRDKKIRLSLIESGEALRKQRVMVDGVYQDIIEEVIRAVNPLVESIVNKAQQVFGLQIRGVHGILLAGGGSDILYHPLLAIWSSVIQIPEPRMAVAEGYLRFGIGLLTQLRRAEQNPS